MINGQQDSRFLIHNPVLGGPNVKLAETATKYVYEVSRTDDLAVALQRCYLQAKLQPTGPVFLSDAMNFMLRRTENTIFKKTRIIEDAVPRSIAEVLQALKAVPSGKLAIVTDYAVTATHGVAAVSRTATALAADIYPLGVGLGLATGKRAVCFDGDGGSLFSIHELCTAAKHAILSIFVCFVNSEYRLLKDLWCNVAGTTIETTQVVGIDFSNPIWICSALPRVSARAWKRLTTFSRSARSSIVQLDIWDRVS